MIHLYIANSLALHRQQANCVHLIGQQFGPMLLVVGGSIENAVDQFDELFGERVDLSDPTLNDYEGGTVQDRVMDAQLCGDVRFNDGGTLVWVDPNEWFESFDSMRDACKRLSQLCVQVRMTLCR